MARTPQQIVSAEFLCNMSWLVATLAGGYGAAVAHVDASGRRSTNGSDLAELTEQAFELACPIDDWEEAAAQAGWRHVTDADRAETRAAQSATYRNGSAFHTGGDWSDLCQIYDIDPYQREVFEHWAVSDWFADKLIEQGEKVDKDFAGLCVWARTTSGQAIYADSIVERIAADLAKGA